MATRSQTTKLAVNSREADGSRSARRLRRAGRVPGVVYGGNDGPQCFDVDERELRHALAARGAVLDLGIDGGAASPVVLKEEDTRRFGAGMVALKGEVAARILAGIARDCAFTERIAAPGAEVPNLVDDGRPPQCGSWP